MLSKQQVNVGKGYTVNFFITVHNFIWLLDSFNFYFGYLYWSDVNRPTLDVKKIKLAIAKVSNDDIDLDNNFEMNKQKTTIVAKWRRVVSSTN